MSNQRFLNLEAFFYFGKKGRLSATNKRMEQTEKEAK